MIRALVTGAGATLGQGIINSLRRSSLPLHVAAADPNPLSPGLFWADEAYRLCLADDPGYIERFSEVLAAARPNVVLIGTDVELAILAAHKDALETAFSTKIIVSSPRVIALADDKYETYRFLEEAGLCPPRSALPENEEALRELVERCGYPLVVKPRVGARSAGVRVVENEQELAAALAGRSRLMVQEMAGEPDREFTASALVFDGRATASIVMRRDLRDGNTHRAYADPNEELNVFVRNAAEALGSWGPVNFQFRTDVQGRPRIFEINARFSGATPLRALVGFNEVEMCIRHILLGEPIVQPPARTGIIMRHLSETLVSHCDLERLR